ncbi:MAG: DeoR/GlpR family DNA-binding transcription regulator [Spirochaetota bacterium]
MFLYGLNSREERIIELLRSGENLSVTDLSTSLEVSAVTVRADLKSLEEKGMIIRTRGGAIPAFHPQLLERRGSHTAEKERIAKAAAEMVHDGDQIMITNGTSSALVGRHLLGKRNIQIVTNSTLLLQYARINPNIDLTMVGGNFRPSVEAVVGFQAHNDIEQYHVALTITGADGFTVEHGITTQLAENAEIVRKMCFHAKKRILVADSSKYGARGFVKILPLQAFDTIITDTALSDEATSEITDLGIEVLRV